MRNNSFPPDIQYIQNVFAQEDDFLKSIRDRINMTDWPIHIGPEEGKLLQCLIHMIAAKKIVEIGTHAGYSTIWMARALPHDGIIYTIEREKNRAMMARQTFDYFDQAEKISFHQGTALEILPTLEEKGPFDLIFIDADKLNYMNYFQWAERNLRKGGIIIGDNTFLSGAVYLEHPPKRVSPTALTAMKEFNLALANHPSFSSIMLPTKEGLSIGVKVQ